MRRRLFLLSVIAASSTLLFRRSYASGILVRTADNGDAWARLGRRAINGLSDAQVDELRNLGQKLVFEKTANISQLEFHITNDFRNGAVVKIDGFSFSKTETAYFIHRADIQRSGS